jgi:hypothetical protein
VLLFKERAMKRMLTVWGNASFPAVHSLSQGHAVLELIRQKIVTRVKVGCISEENVASAVAPG